MSRLIALACAIALAGCSTKQPSGACQLIAIAVDEAQLAEDWYIKASDVLSQCGDKVGALLATKQACAARRFNNSNVECPP